MRNFHVIVVAGGSGTRMKSSLPKQFIEVAGLPVLMHTLNKINTVFPNAGLVLVLPAEHHSTWNSLVSQHNFNLNIQLVQGGETRFHSVKNGLEVIDSGIVAVHDGVRPLVSKETLKNVYDTTLEKGNAVPVISLKDSIRKLHQNGDSEALDRKDFVLVQTPQCFRVDEMKKAFSQEYSNLFTDCASVMEASGHKINLTEGNSENIKITTPEDLHFAELLLKKI